MKTTAVDLVVDLNAMDDAGLPWAFLDQAADPSKVQPGHHIAVGSGVARVVDVDVDDGIVHIRPLRGSVGANAHLLGRPERAAS